MPPTNQRPPGYDPFAYVPRAQQLAQTGVEGFGETLRPGLQREIGNALGGLNSIGALRSGGANVALNDITTNYAQQVGAYGKMAAGEAIGAGLQARGMKDQWQQYQDSKRASLLKSIGGVLGAGIGFAVGGPAGAAAGSSMAGAVTGTGPNGWGGDATRFY